MDQHRLNKKYLLVTLNKNERQKNKNLKRYLSNHEFSSESVETFEDAYNFLLYDTLNPDHTDETEISSDILPFMSIPPIDEKKNKLETDNEVKSVEIIPSNQELLLHWARETFPADSKELQLLCYDGEPTRPISIKSDTNEDSPSRSKSESESDGDSTKRVGNNSIVSLELSNSPDSAESETLPHIDLDPWGFSKYIKKDEEQEREEKNQNANIDDFSTSEDEEGAMHTPSSKRYKPNGLCLYCNKHVDVGSSRKSELRAQSLHIVNFHRTDSISNLEVSRRYRCEGCSRVLSLYQSPCEHLSQSHSREKNETDFIDLWSPDEVTSFNQKLMESFGRRLPVPRSRRMKAADAIIFPRAKANYKIKREDGEVVEEIKTIEEKAHPNKEQMLSSFSSAYDHSPSPTRFCSSSMSFHDDEESQQRVNSKEEKEFGDGKNLESGFHT